MAIINDAKDCDSVVDETTRSTRFTLFMLVLIIAVSYVLVHKLFFFAAECQETFLLFCCMGWVIDRLSCVEGSEWEILRERC